MHEHVLINLAIVAGAALVCGLFFNRIRQPVVVGYIMAGVVLGPSVLGLVAEGEDLELIAELGVLMLLFLIGMELSLRNFRRIWRVALTVAGLQIGSALILAWGLGVLLGWGPELSLIVGFGLGLSSTAVAIKILEDIGELRTEIGRLAVGVLVAQDLAVVPMLIVVGEMGGESLDPLNVAIPLVVAVAILAGLVFALSRRKREHLPFAHWLSDNHDLAAMTGLALCFVCAAVSGLLGLSPAYGAFVGGLVAGNTIERSKMIAAVEPVQSVLLMVFFLTIGLLLDLSFIWDNILLVLAILVGITFIKTGANILIFRLLGEPWPRAWRAGTVIGQVGEFSFVLVASGVAVGVIDTYASRMMTSIIALSLVSSPLFLFTARRLASLRWRRIRTTADIFGALYGPGARALAQSPRRAAAGVSRVGKVTLSAGDYSRSEMDRLMGRLRPRAGPRPADDAPAAPEPSGPPATGKAGADTPNARPVAGD
ncbi:MAG: cation:proton antiporter [Pseudomonadota bacterium]|nr:cation:proton antiporter [Pseudomonadota bacterium]